MLKRLRSKYFCQNHGEKFPIRLPEITTSANSLLIRLYGIDPPMTSLTVHNLGYKILLASRRERDAVSEAHPEACTRKSPRLHPMKDLFSNSLSDFKTSDDTTSSALEDLFQFAEHFLPSSGAVSVASKYSNCLKEIQSSKRNATGKFRSSQVISI